MSRFLHTSVRLHCDLRKAFRLFTQQEELEKWFNKDFVSTVITDQILINKESIKFKFPIKLGDEISELEAENFNVEIKFMQCTSETEYCTEIHLMQYGFEENMESLEIRNSYLLFWKTNLENLRQKINGDWVIKDSELTLRFLM